MNVKCWVSKFKKEYLTDYIFLFSSRIFLIQLIAMSVSSVQIQFGMSSASLLFFYFTVVLFSTPLSKTDISWEKWFRWIVTQPHLVFTIGHLKTEPQLSSVAGVNPFFRKVIFVSHNVQQSLCCTEQSLPCTENRDVAGKTWQALQMC